MKEVSRSERISTDLRSHLKVAFLAGARLLPRVRARWTVRTVSATMSAEKSLSCSLAPCAWVSVHLLSGGNDARRNRTRLHRSAGTRLGCYPSVRTQPADHDPERSGCCYRAGSTNRAPDVAHSRGIGL